VIRLHRLDGSELIINADLIEAVEARPDTIITLVTGKKYVVSDTVSRVLGQTIAYKRAVAGGPRAAGLGCVLRLPTEEEDDEGPE
jgi:flagellar protein FlbD